jgi:hypothetical protein
VVCNAGPRQPEYDIRASRRVIGKRTRRLEDRRSSPEKPPTRPSVQPLGVHQRQKAGQVTQPEWSRPLPHPRTAQRPPQHRTATGVSSCRADVRFAHSRRTARTRAVLHPHDPTRFAQPHRPHSREGIPGDSPTTRARTGAPAHPGRSASRGARAKLSLTARLPVPRAALSAGRFAELRRSTSPTLLQSSSCARPDPHPVVGVRIGPNCSAPRSSGSVASSAGLRAALSLPPVGWRRCSPRSRRTGATRWRRLPHPALSAQPERGFGRPLRGFPRRCRALPGAAVVAPGVITLTPPKGPGSARCDALSPFRVPASPPGARLPSQPHDPTPGGSNRNARATRNRVYQGGSPARAIGWTR